MYKVVVSEFDRTLINSEEAISSSTVMEIDRIRNKGCLFCISTDRVLSDVLNYNKDFIFTDYIISCSGAYLYDVLNDKVIYKKNITNVVLKKILDNFSDYDIYAYLEDRCWLIKNIVKEKIYKLEIVCPSKKILNSISEKLDELELNIKFFSKKTDKNYVIEIIMDSVDKSVCIEKICKLRKISMDEVVYIGSCEKDSFISKKVGCSVCVKNGDSSMKKECNMICPSNDDKGVKNVLSQLIK